MIKQNLLCFFIFHNIELMNLSKLTQTSNPSNLNSKSILKSIENCKYCQKKLKQTEFIFSD